MGIFLTIIILFFLLKGNKVFLPLNYSTKNIEKIQEVKSEKIDIKTDCNLTLKEERLMIFDSNLNKIGVDVEKEKGDSLDKSVYLFKRLSKENLK